MMTLKFQMGEVCVLQKEKKKKMFEWNCFSSFTFAHFHATVKSKQCLLNHLAKSLKCHCIAHIS